VTEQDVINEEMYEEEDDDLQSQYRRLQAHLGSSADLFNGRLNAWVLSHYGTRQMAMAAQNGIAFNRTMNMQPPNAQTPFFAYQPQPRSPTGNLSLGMTQRNQSYRQSPYPQQYHRMQDQLSHSISSAQEQHLQQGVSDASADTQTMQHQRRHSTATQSDGQSNPGTPQSQSDVTPPSMSRTISGMQPGHLGHSAFFTDQQFQGAMSPQFSFGGFPTGTSSFDPMMNQMQSPISPLTTSLPVEAQQVIGTNFDQHNQYTQMFMNMAHGLPVPPGINYTYRPNSESSNLKSGSEGIHQTLSLNPMSSPPAKIDTTVDNMNTQTLTNNSLSSAEGYNGQHAPLSFDGGFGLGKNFDKTSGDQNTTGASNDGFFNDWVEDGA
jgi:hypothetical protein